MTDARPKHKPNEKHTLDEVLKSLKDLVHGEVLDQPAPPAAPPTKAVEPAPPMADMRDIISSLEDLLESDLNLEEKVERAKAALAPVAQPRDRDAKPKTAPTKPAPAPEAPQTRLAPAPAEPKPAPPPPARPAVPPPPVTPMFEAEDNLEFESGATPADAVAPVEFPEEMSDDDIAKALAEIQTEMDAAPAAQPEPEPEIEFIDAEPESIAIDAAPPPPEPAPPLELSIEEPAELAQRDLSLEPAFASPDTSGLSVVEDEIAAAPAPDATAGELTVGELAADTAAEEIIAPAAPTPEDGDFNIDFAPRKPPPPAEPDHVEDLAPPPWEDDGTIDRAEPPTTSGDISGGSLGESVELDLSIADTVGGDAPRPDAVAELAPETEVIVTEIVAQPAPTEPEVATAPAPAKKELKVVEPDTEIVATEIIAPPEPELVTPPAPAKKELKIVEPDAPPAKKPKPPAAKPAKEIPVLKDVAIAPSPATAPESFTLELTPAVPPKPASPLDLHQMAVRIIAKLNIEMRKAGKPPLDAKTINRLQQLLRESLSEAGNQTHKK